MNKDRYDEENEREKLSGFEKLKDLLGFRRIEEDPLDDDYDDDEYYGEEEKQPSAKKLYGASTSPSDQQGYNSGASRFTTNTSSASYTSGQSTPKVYPIKGTGTAPQSYASKVDVLVIKPTSYGDGKKIADNLKKGKLVILNMEKFDVKEAHKVFQFCLGAICVLEGKAVKVANGIFILAPSNVDISDNIREELKQKGILDGLGFGEE